MADQQIAHKSVATAPAAVPRVRNRPSGKSSSTNSVQPRQAAHSTSPAVPNLASIGKFAHTIVSLSDILGQADTRPNGTTGRQICTKAFPLTASLQAVINETGQPQLYTHGTGTSSVPSVLATKSGSGLLQSPRSSNVPTTMTTALPHNLPLGSVIQLTQVIPQSAQAQTKASPPQAEQTMPMSHLGATTNKFGNTQSSHNTAPVKIAAKSSGKASKSSKSLSLNSNNASTCKHQCSKSAGLDMTNVQDTSDELLKSICAVSKISKGKCHKSKKSVTSMHCKNKQATTSGSIPIVASTVNKPVLAMSGQQLLSSMVPNMLNHIRVSGNLMANGTSSTILPVISSAGNAINTAAGGSVVGAGNGNAIPLQCSFINGSNGQQIAVLWAPNNKQASTTPGQLSFIPITAINTSNLPVASNGEVIQPLPATVMVQSNHPLNKPPAAGSAAATPCAIKSSPAPVRIEPKVTTHLDQNQTVKQTVHLPANLMITGKKSTIPTSSANSTCTVRQVLQRAAQDSGQSQLETRKRKSQNLVEVSTQTEGTGVDTDSPTPLSSDKFNIMLTPVSQSDLSDDNDICPLSIEELKETESEALLALDEPICQVFKAEHSLLTPLSTSNSCFMSPESNDTAKEICDSSSAHLNTQPQTQQQSITSEKSQLQDSDPSSDTFVQIDQSLLFNAQLSESNIKNVNDLAYYLEDQITKDSNSIVAQQLHLDQFLNSLTTSSTSSVTYPNELVKQEADEITCQILQDQNIATQYVMNKRIKEEAQSDQHIEQTNVELSNIANGQYSVYHFTDDQEEDKPLKQSSQTDGPVNKQHKANKQQTNLTTHPPSIYLHGDMELNSTAQQSSLLAGVSSSFYLTEDEEDEKLFNSQLEQSKQLESSLAIDDLTSMYLYSNQKYKDDISLDVFNSTQTPTVESNFADTLLSKSICSSSVFLNEGFKDDILGQAQEHRQSGGALYQPSLPTLSNSTHDLLSLVSLNDGEPLECTEELRSSFLAQVNMADDEDPTQMEMTTFAMSMINNDLEDWQPFQEQTGSVYVPAQTTSTYSLSGPTCSTSTDLLLGNLRAVNQLAESNPSTTIIEFQKYQPNQEEANQSDVSKEKVFYVNSSGSSTITSTATSFSKATLTLTMDDTDRQAQQNDCHDETADSLEIIIDSDPPTCLTVKHFKRKSGGNSESVELSIKNILVKLLRSMRIDVNVHDFPVSNLALVRRIKVKTTGQKGPLEQLSDASILPTDQVIIVHPNVSRELSSAEQLMASVMAGVKRPLDVTCESLSASHPDLTKSTTSTSSGVAKSNRVRSSRAKVVTHTANALSMAILGAIEVTTKSLANLDRDTVCTNAVNGVICPNVAPVAISSIAVPFVGLTSTPSLSNGLPSDVKVSQAAGSANQNSLLKSMLTAPSIYDSINAVASLRLIHSALPDLTITPVQTKVEKPKTKPKSKKKVTDPEVTISMISPVLNVPKVECSPRQIENKLTTSAPKRVRKSRAKNASEPKPSTAQVVVAKKSFVLPKKPCAPRERTPTGQFAPRLDQDGNPIRKRPRNKKQQQQQQQQTVSSTMPDTSEVSISLVDSRTSGCQSIVDSIGPTSVVSTSAISSVLSSGHLLNGLLVQKPPHPPHSRSAVHVQV